MLPDGFPKPPFAAIFLVSALVSAFLGYQAAGLLSESIGSWDRFVQVSPETAGMLAAGMGSLLGLLVFLAGSGLAIVVFITVAYIRQHHREEREEREEREDTLQERPRWQRSRKPRPRRLKPRR